MWGYKLADSLGFNVNVYLQFYAYKVFEKAKIRIFKVWNELSVDIDYLRLHWAEAFVRRMRRSANLTSILLLRIFSLTYDYVLKFTLKHLYSAIPEQNKFMIPIGTKFKLINHSFFQHLLTKNYKKRKISVRKFHLHKLGILKLTNLYWLNSCKLRYFLHRCANVQLTVLLKGFKSVLHLISIHQQMLLW